MSKYIHPMQDEYNKKVQKILQHLMYSDVQLNSFIRILTENQIKFFSKDDVTKFSKLCNPFDKLNPKSAFIHLQLIYVHTSLDVPYFVVKYTGKLFKALNLKPIEIKKNTEMHTIGLCVLDFKRKMEKLHGGENFWFKALGGISGTNSIKRELLEKKVAKIFINSCHSTCVHRLMNFITDSNPEGEITWESLRKKINFRNYFPNAAHTKEINVSLSPGDSLEKQKKTDPNYIRISVFESPDSKVNELSVSQNIRGDNQNHSVLEERPRRRLKTLIDRPKMVTQSCNLQLSMGPLVEEIIHSKNRYKLFGPIKKCKTSLGEY